MKAYKGSWPIVKDSAIEYLYYTEKRFASYVNMLAAGVDVKHMEIFMEAEKGALIQQLETMSIISASAIQGTANSIIQLFTDTYFPPISLPTLPTVPVNTSEAAYKGNQLVGEEFLGDSRIVAPQVTGTGTIAPDKGTQFGVFTSGELTIPQVITLAGKLGVNLVRLGINADSWKGKNIALDQLLRAGIKVVTTLNWNTIRNSDGIRVAQPWVRPDEYNDYSNWIEDVLTKYPGITAVTIGNEECVDLFNSGTAQEYVGQLAVASKVCRKHGIPITNGGLTNPGLQINVYRYLLGLNRIADSNGFYNNCMDKRIRKTAKYPGNDSVLESKATETAYLLSNYGKLIDYVNIHWYEPLVKDGWLSSAKDVSPGALQWTVEYIKSVTKLPVVSFETGTLNGQSKLVSAVMADMQSNGLLYCIWFSATSENGQTDPLNIGTDLNNMGEIFHDFLN